jgi:hypothetical protein
MTAPLFPIEIECRRAGTVSTNDTAARAEALSRIAKVFTADICDADLKAVADFLMGRYDRSPGDGRPRDLFKEWKRIGEAQAVRCIRQELHCSLDEAIRVSLIRMGDPADERAVRQMRKRLKR